LREKDPADDKAKNALGAIAYRSGEQIRDADGVIVHDYTRRGGVIYGEIILPEGAPPEFADREILWNAVEASEKRKDARLAREVEVALQKEFELQEQIAVLREFIQENFVDKGMCADVNIHNNDGNPHAHIMLTTRNVTPDGFGKKNTEWNSRASLIEWRENWADVNNRMFENKGLAERIDHRTLKAQGIDREPTIHIGHVAWALEKKGIHTDKGDYNRAIQKRNAEREPLKEELTILNKKELTELWTQLKAEKGAQYKEELQKQLEQRQAVQNLNELEIYLRAEKATQIVEKMQEKREARRESEIVKQMGEMKETYIALEKELRALKAERSAGRLDKIDTRIPEIIEKQKAIELKYKINLFTEKCFEKPQKNKPPEQTQNPLETVRERRLREECTVWLNSISDECLQKVIDNAPPDISKNLIDIQKKREEIKIREENEVREKARTEEKVITPELF
jgi:ATP-dependent exoDNAse (exonuclease V) alpha subunit